MIGKETTAVWLLTGAVAGVLAGAIMGILSQLGYRAGYVKSHLIAIDGAFVLRTLRRGTGPRAVYVAGVLTHLVTSAVFGAAYLGIASVAGVNPRQALPVALYTSALWLAMLVVALPVAGQGFLGRRLRSPVWLEQLVLHVIFGTGLWWAIGAL